VIEIRRAYPGDHGALSAIRRSAILELAVAAMSPSQAEQWANQAAADRVTGAILHHAVWVAVQGVSNAVTFYLHRGYLPSGARTADGALPLSKRMSEHGPNPPLQPTTSAGG